MTSKEFEITCKRHIIKALEENYQDYLTLDELHIVWFSKALQNYKCTMIDLRKNQRYYECTYNGDKNELYVDIYEKKYNIAYKVQ